MSESDLPNLPRPGRTGAPSRARRLDRALVEKLQYESRELDLRSSKTDFWYLFLVMTEWLEVNNCAITKDGVRRFRSRS